MATTARGHIEQLPSGSFRVHVYAGTDPVTGKPRRLKQTCPDEASAAAALGKLLAQADGDRQARGVGDQFAGRVGLFLRVDDFDTAHERMLRHGVSFLTPPRDEPYGRVAVFVDVAGNRWDLLGPRTVPDGS